MPPLQLYTPYRVNSSTPKPRKAIQIKLSEQALEEILRGGAHAQLSIQGDALKAIVKLQVGSSTFDCMANRESWCDAFRLAPGQMQLELVGPVLHKFTVKRELDAKVSSKMKSRAEAIKEEKNKRKAVFLDNPAFQKSTPTGTKTVASTTRKTAPKLAGSTRPKASSPAVTSSNTSAAKPGGIPVRPRVAQLLAWKPQTLSEIAQKTKASESDIIPVLKLIATASGENWQLRPEIYKEIKVYDWAVYDTKTKETVARNARKAFDQLNLPANAPERKKLLPPTSTESRPRVSPNSSGTQPSSTPSATPNNVVAAVGPPESKRRKTDSSGSSSERSDTNTKSTKSKPTKLKTTKKTSTATTTPAAAKNSKTVKERLKAASVKAAALPGKVPSVVTAGVSQRQLPSSTSRFEAANTLTNVVSTPIPKDNASILGGGEEKRKETNGYKIPRKLPSVNTSANGSVKGKVKGDATAEVTEMDIDNAAEHQQFKVPTVTTVTDFTRLTKTFEQKYEELTSLYDKMKQHRPYVEEFTEKLNRAAGTDDEIAVRRAAHERLGREKAPELWRMANKYYRLHQELDATKKELYRAVREEKLLGLAAG